ncbi:MAG TPA: PP2C family protein-serine/threonine phosphatase, partial [bacterium]|nr:PP2C family protein-serine/threonine phosphatase [bacterium]
LNEVGDLAQLTQLLLEQLGVTVGAASGLLLLQGEGQLELCAADGIAREVGDGVLAKGLFSQADGSSFLSRVVRERSPYLVVNQPLLGQFEALIQGQGLADRLLAGPAAPLLLKLHAALPFALQAAVYVPLCDRDELRGVVILFNPLSVNSQPEYITDLTTIANYGVLAIARAQLFALTLAKERMDHELMLAGKIQRQILPAVPTGIPGFGFFADCLPASVIGGDYYDFFRLSGRPELLGLLLTDVQGKGMPAAIVMAQLAAAVRAYKDFIDSPGLLMERLNRFMLESFPDMLQPLFLGFLDLSRQRLWYVNAGHQYPLLYRAATSTVEQLTDNAMILGMDPDAGYREHSLVLLPGDVLLLYTNGVTDARNAQRQELNGADLTNILKCSNLLTAEEVGRAVLRAVRVFAGDTPQFDDITVLVVKAQ